MKIPDAEKISRFENSDFDACPGPQWETPGSHNRMDYGSINTKGEGSVEHRSSRQPGQQNVEKTMAILRDNLKKILIELN